MKRENRRALRQAEHLADSEMKLRGFPPRATREEREALNGKVKVGMKREERATWRIHPRIYATLKRAIADLEIIIQPIEHSGDCAKALKYLRRMERKSNVRWGRGDKE